MNGGGPGSLALPESAQVEALMRQNAEVVEMQNRAGAVQLAIQLASVGPDSSIGKVLENAKHIAHFTKTGHVPGGAKDG